MKSTLSWEVGEGWIGVPGGSELSHCKQGFFGPDSPICEPACSLPKLALWACIHATINWPAMPHLL